MKLKSNHYDVGSIEITSGYICDFKYFRVGNRNHIVDYSGRQSIVAKVVETENRFDYMHIFYFPLDCENPEKYDHLFTTETEMKKYMHKIIELSIEPLRDLKVRLDELETSNGYF